MGLIAEIGIVFAVGLLLSGVYQAWKRRPLAEAAHMAIVFGLFAAVVYFMVLIFTDITNIRPEPEAAARPLPVLASR